MERSQSHVNFLNLFNDDPNDSEVAGVHSEQIRVDPDAHSMSPVVGSYRVTMLSG